LTLPSQSRINAGRVPSSSDPRWLFGPRTDVLAFLGAALASAVVAWLVPVHETPLWAWVLLVLCVDVAHVWATLFRVYLDGEEVRRRAGLYFAAPLIAYVGGVLAHQVSAGFFWRCFAYVAALHFVRQQVGWMVLYGRRNKDSEGTVRFDRVAIYAATLGPLVWWHANLPRPFSWFMDGDFVTGLPTELGTAALPVHALILAAWVVDGLYRHTRGEKFHLGKLLLLAATWVAWFGGIVLAESDTTFTAMNVMLHGVPYFVLLYRYAKTRHAEGGYGKWGVILRAGVPGFVAFLLALAFLEELLWDRFVWHERPMLFGARGLELGPEAMALVVPLLSLPQATHYLLDGFVWRTKDDPNLVPRLGWAKPPAASVDHGRQLAL
jgi:hypothetical protein